MLYITVLVSAVYQHKSALGIHICPFSLEPPSYVPPHPIPLGHHRAPSWSSLHHTAHFRRLSNFTYGNVCVLMLLSQFTPPSPYLPGPHVCSLCCISITDEWIKTLWYIYTMEYNSAIKGTHLT